MMLRYGLASALPLVFAAGPSLAQTGDPKIAPAVPQPPLSIASPVEPPAMAVDQGNTPLGDGQVAFTANTLDYDDKAQIVTATGDVRMIRQGSRLRADKVVWNRGTNVADAYGNVATENPQGDIAYGDSMELTDDLKNGDAQNMLLVLENGGRMAANKGTRKDNVYYLERASYSPCDVTTDSGCPKQPLWEITAAHVVYDPARHRVSYRDARLRFLGLPIAWLPAFSHPDGTGAGGNSGLLVPNITYNNANGIEVDTPYFVQMGPNRDLTLTPHIYSKVLPLAEAQYRALNSLGAFQIHGYATYSAQSTSDTAAANRIFRGYIDANGKYQLGPFWSISASIREVTDKTFLRRYSISDDDRLRSVIKAERIDTDSYLSIAGWEFRTLVLGEKQSQQPIALPAIDYRRRIADPWLGGTFTFQANSLAITRPEGQDTQRAFAGAQWEKWLLTPLGQQVTFTAYSRGDVYHSDQNDLTSTVIYQGEPGWKTRAIAALAADVRWPFVGEFLGGSQRITPRIQLVASPHASNLDIPNEDARAIDLEDSNLFALNRFPGYDRWEGGSRVTYGFEYALDLPRFAFRSIIGQSYSFNGNSSIFPAGTGLSGKTSDIVGRFTARYGSFVSFTNSFRVDKNSLAVRRDEADVTVGSAKSYLQAGYLYLHRDISPDIEDLRDHQEVRLGARVAILKRWSLYGSTTINLSKSSDDVFSDGANSGGFDPVQSRVGLAYEDDCFAFSVNWHRDYNAFGDGRRGSTIQFQLAFKNLGR